VVTKKSFWKKENKLFNKGDIEEKLRSLLKGVYHKEKIDYLRRKSSGYNSEGTTSKCGYTFLKSGLLKKNYGV